jgi:hypothetical protein
MKRRGEILVENVVFIVLNLMFLSILVLFLLKQGQGAVLMEDAYSKQIALLVDSSVPGTIIKINLEKGYEISKENNVPFGEIISFQDNYVTVRLSEKGGERYHFFHDINVSAYPDRDQNNEFNGIYVLTFS